MTTGLINFFKSVEIALKTSKNGDDIATALTQFIADGHQLTFDSKDTQILWLSVLFEYKCKKLDELANSTNAWIAMPKRLHYLRDYINQIIQLANDFDAVVKSGAIDKAIGRYLTFGEEPDLNNGYEFSWEAIKFAFSNKRLEETAQNEVAAKY